MANQNNLNLGQQLDLIYDSINQKPKETIEYLMQNGATPEVILKIILKGVQEGKINPLIGEAIVKAILPQQPLLTQTLAARHGAKLNYLKALKNQCPEGQEPYYYKKGGMVKCGCTGRKFEDGGKAKKENAVDKFKKQQNGGTFKAVGRFAKAVTKSAKTAINKAEEEHRKKSEWKVSGKNTSKNSDYAEYDKCGSKIKKHNNGGSLNGVPFTKKYQIGGYIDYPTNQALHNIGDKIGDTIESTGYAGDFLPIVSTLKAAREIGTGRPNASWGKLITSGIGDAVGFGMMSSVAKAIPKYSRIVKNLKANGYFRPTDTGTLWIKVGTKETPINAGRFGTIGTKIEPAVYVKNVPEVDYTGVALAPLVLTLRVPFTAPFVKDKEK